jgi:tetratricopeptide (TPR) repeat protein
MLGEIQLELGEYEEAARTFGTLFTLRTGLTVAPRYARWEEVRGHPAEARRLLRAAQREAAGRHAMPPSQLVWFHWRLADLALRAGHLDEAERELQAGLRLAAEDHRLLDGQARVALARGRWDDAVALGERAILGRPDPGTLALLVAGYEALGDSTRSADYQHALSVAVAAQPGGGHRMGDLFLLDRSREVPRVLARARQDLRTRRDVYGWDLLGWALYRSGDLDGALEAADKALALGTRDASLHFHAGMIAARAGRTGLAVRRLEEALAINPRWHPTQPDEARATLRRLADARARA